MRSSTPSYPHALSPRRTTGSGARRRLSAVLATLVASSALVAVGGPAQGAVSVLSHTCSNEINEPATVNIDTNAPATMYVNEQTGITATTNLTWPGKTTYNMMLAWGAGWVEGTGTFKVDVGSTPATFTTPFTRVNVKAGWMTNGSDSDLIPLNSSTSSTVQVTAPATPGSLAITESKSAGKSLDAAITFHRNSWIFGNFDRATSCVHAVAPNPTIDTITVRSRSHVTDFTLTPPSVQQNSTTTASARVSVDGGTLNGTVTFVDEGTGTELASVPVVAAATSTTVSATLPVQPVGSHSIAAHFIPSDTTLYDPSVSSLQTLEVKAARATTTTVALSKTEIAPNGSSIATATVQPATGGGTPAGSVRFTYGSTDTVVALGPGGTATHTISGLAIGDYPVRATFVPTDVNSWVESQSASTLLTVVKRAAVSTTTLSFTHNPALTTDTVSAEATVEIAGGATAAGSVSFTITGGVDGSVFETPPAVPVGSGGTASVDLSDLAAGPYEVLAEFTPTESTDQTLSASPTTVFTVTEPPIEPAIDTTTTLALDKTTAFAGESATATATVGAVSGPTQPQGSVVFSVNGLDRAPVALTNGTAPLTLPNLAVGTYAVTARFVAANPAVFNSSGPTAPQQLTVAKRPAVTTSTTLSLAPASITEDEDTTVTATVTAASGALAGDISFAVTRSGVTTTHVRPHRVGGTPLVLSGLAPGSYSVVATFIPASTDDFTASASNTATLTVTAAPPSATTTTLSVSRTHATTTQAVSATARVAAGRGPVSGTVVFSYGATTITAPVADGAARIDLVGLAVGVNTIAASFTPAPGATGQFLPSSATPRTVTVTEAAAAATVTSVTLSDTSTAANAPVTAQIYVAGTGETPTGTVTLGFQGRTSAATPLVDGAALITVPTKADGTYDVGDGPVVAAYTPTSASISKASTGSDNLSVTAAVGSTRTSTTLSLDRSTIIVGEAAVATARVAMAGSPTGSVIFGYRGVEQGVPLVDGSATFELPGTTSGNFAVTARFVPTDGSQRASNAAPAMLTVSPVTAAPSSTSLSLSTNSIDVGDSLTATAVVSSSQRTLGDVRFTVGAESISAEVDPDTGKAVASLASVPVGTHAVTATFVPDDATTLQGSTSASRSVTVVATSAVNLSLSADTVVEGSSVSATAAVTALGGPTAGQVTFHVGGREVAVPVANGAATAKLPGIAPGEYDVVAAFAPAQTGMRAANSQTRSLVVTKALATTPPPSGGTQTPAGATTLALSTSRPSSAYGQPTSVVATAPAGVDGFVQFTVGGFSQDVPVQQGTATLTVPRTLPVGSHTVNATLVPTDPGAFRQSIAGTTLVIVRDSSVVKFAKRWTPATRTLQVRARVAGAFGTSGTGRVVFTLTQAPPRTGKGKKSKAVKISKAAGALDANGVATVKLPTKGKLGTFTVKVSYAGSSTLLPSTLLKSLRIR